MPTRPSRASTSRAKTSADVFQRAFHSSPAMQTVTRVADRVLVEANEAFLSTLGYTRDEVIGKVGLETKIWVSQEKVQPFRAELAARGVVRGFELEIRAKSGDVRTVLLSAEIVDIGGEPHVVAAGVDITQRQKAVAELQLTHERLRQSEERFSKAFRANPALVALTRADDGKLVSVNEAFREITGYTEAEAIGKTTVELGIYERPEIRERFLQGVKDHGFVRDHEHLLRTKEGALRTLLLSTEEIEVDGAPHLLTVGLDITQRKRAEAEQEIALQRERELSQLKTDFVSIVSHEFRTPLEIIMSSVDNLDRYHDRLPVEKRGQLLRTINKSVRRMAGMMEEVLLLGRFDGGGTEFKPASLELAAFLQRVCDEMASATNRRCPILIEVPDDLAGARGDEVILRHILTNLLSNAVKYSEPGQSAMLVVRRDGVFAIVRITDHGCGIPADDQQRLFQAFHRGSNVRQIPGTGLGLLIVRRCVDLHGGEIEFESREGRGTTFTVRLPLFAGKA